MTGRLAGKLARTAAGTWKLETPSGGTHRNMADALRALSTLTPVTATQGESPGVHSKVIPSPRATSLS